MRRRSKAYKLSIPGERFRQLFPLIAFAIGTATFTLATDNFLSGTNVTYMLRDAAFLGIVSLGFGRVLIGGSCDLSVAGTAAAVSIISARFSSLTIFGSYPHGIIVIVFSAALGAALGTITGFVVSGIRIPAFLTTLALGLAYSGIGQLCTEREVGNPVYHQITNPSVRQFGRLFLQIETGSFEMKIYLIVICWILLTVLTMILGVTTKYAEKTRACGSDPVAAANNGINVAAVRLSLFSVSGGLVGFAAALYTATNLTPSVTIATGYEFHALAICVVGGFSLSGGRGTSANIFLMSLLTVMVSNGLTKISASGNWLYIIEGVVFALVLIYDFIFKKRVSKSSSGSSLTAAARL